VLDATDIILIHQLLGSYGHLIDHRRWDDFAALFVEDATIDYIGGSGRVTRSGRSSIVAWFQEVDEQHPPAHHVTNIVVDTTGAADGPADVHSKFIAPFTRGAHTPKRLYGGDYHDVVVRTGDGWRFAHKQCLPRWQVAVQVDESAPDHRRTF
jgi:3-phenylpropionate/cinnamic acid dioxygenase small subunit